MRNQVYMNIAAVHIQCFCQQHLLCHMTHVAMTTFLETQLQRDLTKLKCPALPPICCCQPLLHQSRYSLLFSTSQHEGRTVNRVWLWAGCSNPGHNTRTCQLMLGSQMVYALSTSTLYGHSEKLHQVVRTITPV